MLRHAGAEVYAEVLSDHQRLIRGVLADHGGREVDTQGDAFFAVFAAPETAVAAVTEMQRRLAKHSWPGETALRVRMGVHSGQAVRSASGLVGFDVHRAARIAGVAHGGQVVLSETTALLVKDSLPAGMGLRDLGAHRLKDMGRPEQIWQLCAEGLAVEFPPLRSLDNPALRNNLPSLPGRFIGRDKELARLRDLLTSNRLVTLTGGGGTGKTRLALHAAAELLDGSGDGVWLVEFAAVTYPALVATAICDAIGIPSQPGRPALEVLVDALAVQDLLIVMDNCEHLIDACAKTADVVLRACPKVKLLATSREPLGIGGETIYRVPTLSLPQAGYDPEKAENSDAVALFIDRAAAQGIDLPLAGEPAQLVAGICRRLDGLPLAIELAAARLRSLSLRDISQRLEDRFRLLTGGSRSAPQRHQTLRAVVDWSYSLLNDSERSALRRLSVFVDGFDLHAAEAVCAGDNTDTFDIADLIGSLVDKSLIVTEPGSDTLRYRMLETIRQYSTERLADAGGGEQASAEQAHCHYYLSLAETASEYLTGQHQTDWLARLDLDQANIRRALQHATNDPTDQTLVLRFAVALGRYWIVRQLDRDALELVGPVLDRPDKESDSELFAEALSVVARLSRFAEPAIKEALCARALETARRHSNTPLLARALATVASVRAWAGDWAEALVLAQEAVDIARALGDDVLLPEVLNPYSVCIEKEDPARADELFEEALSCTERSSDGFTRYMMLITSGNYSLLVGHLSGARTRLREAAALGHHLGLGGHARIALLVNLGWVEREEGQLQGARTTFEEVLDVSRHNGQRDGLAAASLGLACIATDLGDWTRASQLHGIAQALYETIGYVWQPPEDTYLQQSMEKVYTHLGEDRYQVDYQRAKGFTVEDAITSIVETTQGL